jgi:hypothetical protein
MNPELIDDVDDDEDEPDVVLRMSLWTNKIRSNVDTVVETGIPQSDWDEMSEYDRETFARDAFNDYAMDRMGGWTWEER